MRSGLIACFFYVQAYPCYDDAGALCESKGGAGIPWALGYLYDARNLYWNHEWGNAGCS